MDNTPKRANTADAATASTSRETQKHVPIPAADTPDRLDRLNQPTPPNGNVTDASAAFPDAIPTMIRVTKVAKGSSNSHPGRKRDKGIGGKRVADVVGLRTSHATVTRSQGFSYLMTVPKPIIESLGWKIGDAVMVETWAGSGVIRLRLAGEGY